ncbi:hypothetical protein JQ607_30940 [Bradyrhizobium liaoningense]|uniref:hypothetical protein n=1 Tax=Bradyrhizobium liaoningense TaxID=43992 RepID=UPI001BA99818|nr:hypothetical protein [Bradyrhizobium liaoningense]MBR0844637.1 hypothetical protein [Bradyrhizobium liaoningense]
MTVVTILALAASSLSWPSRSASAQTFDPVSKLTTWYTDRNPIDIEITAAVGVGDEARPIDPPRVLRLRLERAYVHSLIGKPPISIVGLSFDLLTGLPSALFTAPPEQVDARGDPIRQIAHTEAITRTINVVVESNFSSESMRGASAKISKCKGAEIQSDLLAFDKDRDRTCTVWSLISGTTYVGHLSENNWLFIHCSSVPIGCTVRFPFGGFFPSVSFNERHLSHWKAIIEKATEFLKSKEVVTP